MADTIFNKFSFDIDQMMEEVRKAAFDFKTQDFFCTFQCECDAAFEDFTSKHRKKLSNFRCLNADDLDFEIKCDKLLNWAKFDEDDDWSMKKTLRRVPVCQQYCKYSPWMPRSKTMSEYLHGEGLKISLDVRHYKQHELSVKVLNNIVRIEGKAEDSESENNFIRKNFVREITIPEVCDKEKIVSNVSSNGTLTVWIPAKEEFVKNANRRIVDIQQSGDFKSFIHEAEKKFEETAAKLNNLKDANERIVEVKLVGVSKRAPANVASERVIDVKQTGSNYKTSVETEQNVETRGERVVQIKLVGPSKNTNPEASKTENRENSTKSVERIVEIRRTGLPSKVASVNGVNERVVEVKQTGGQERSTTQQKTESLESSVTGNERLVEVKQTRVPLKVASETSESIETSESSSERSVKTTTFGSSNRNVREETLSTERIVPITQTGVTTRKDVEHQRSSEVASSVIQAAKRKVQNEQTGVPHKTETNLMSDQSSNERIVEVKLVGQKPEERKTNTTTNLESRQSTEIEESRTQTKTELKNESQERVVQIQQTGVPHQRDEPAKKTERPASKERIVEETEAEMSNLKERIIEIQQTGVAHDEIVKTQAEKNPRHQPDNQAVKPAPQEKTVEETVEVKESNRTERIIEIQRTAESEAIPKSHTETVKIEDVKDEEVKVEEVKVEEAEKQREVKLNVDLALAANEGIVEFEEPETPLRPLEELKVKLDHQVEIESVTSADDYLQEMSESKTRTERCSEDIFDFFHAEQKETVQDDDETSHTIKTSKTPSEEEIKQKFIESTEEIIVEIKKNEESEKRSEENSLEDAKERVVEIVRTGEPAKKTEDLAKPAEIRQDGVLKSENNRVRNIFSSVESTEEERKTVESMSTLSKSDERVVEIKETGRVHRTGSAETDNHSVETKTTPVPKQIVMEVKSENSANSSSEETVKVEQIGNTHRTVKETSKQTSEKTPTGFKASFEESVVEVSQTKSPRCAVEDVLKSVDIRQDGVLKSGGNRVRNLFSSVESTEEERKSFESKRDERVVDIKETGRVHRTDNAETDLRQERPLDIKNTVAPRHSVVEVKSENSANSSCEETVKVEQIGNTHRTVKETSKQTSEKTPTGFKASFEESVVEVSQTKSPRCAVEDVLKSVDIRQDGVLKSDANRVRNLFSSVESTEEERKTVGSTKLEERVVEIKETGRVHRKNSAETDQRQERIVETKKIPVPKQTVMEVKSENSANSSCEETVKVEQIGNTHRTVKETSKQTSEKTPTGFKASFEESVVEVSKTACPRSAIGFSEERTNLKNTGTIKKSQETTRKSALDERHSRDTSTIGGSNVKEHVLEMKSMEDQQKTHQVNQQFTKLGNIGGALSYNECITEVRRASIPQKSVKQVDEMSEHDYEVESVDSYSSATDRKREASAFNGYNERIVEIKEVGGSQKPSNKFNDNLIGIKQNGRHEANTNLASESKTSSSQYSYKSHKSDVFESTSLATEAKILKQPSERVVEINHIH